MHKFLDVPTYFTKVYLVDLSPSLCDVARNRFERLGWENIEVVCQDARLFRLDVHGEKGTETLQSLVPGSYFDAPSVGGASLITLSYSLSMIPDFYSVI